VEFVVQTVVVAVVDIAASVAAVEVAEAQWQVDEELVADIEVAVASVELVALAVVELAEVPLVVAGIAAA
jgi:hypothetical protein